jgi:hypothetical protein
VTRRLLLVPYWSVFCGVTAARLYGLPVPGGDQRVHVAVPSSTRTIARTRNPCVHSYTISPEHRRKVSGRWVVAPERLFLELAATLARIDLIIAGDQMLRRELTTPQRLERFLSTSRRRRGVRRARAAVPLLERDAWPQPESRLRILLIDAGLPRPGADQDVLNDWGVLLATPTSPTRSGRSPFSTKAVIIRRTPGSTPTTSNVTAGSSTRAGWPSGSTETASSDTPTCWWPASARPSTNAAPSRIELRHSVGTRRPATNEMMRLNVRGL